MTLAERQGSDAELSPIIRYLREGILLDEEKAAKDLALNKKQYVLMDNVLYHLATDNSTLRIIPPVKDRSGIIRETHNDRLAGHLRDAKVHGQIGRTYWWPGTHKEVTQFCIGCE